MVELGTTERPQKDYVASERMCREALPLRKKIPGDSHIDTLVSMNDLIVTLKRHGHN